MGTLKLALLLLVPCVLASQEFTVREEMVAMRDGVQLATDVYMPRSAGKHPVLVSRTPYGKAGLRGDSEYLARRGYVVIAQDCRGRFHSQGRFYGFINEGPDGYDTIEWAASQPWSDGEVGTFGASYLAWDQYFAAMYRPPHLVAMFALVGGAKFYDEYAYPGGIPNLGWPVWMLKSAQTSPQAKDHAPEEKSMAKLLDETPAPWLKQSPQQRADIFQQFPDQLHMYKDFLEHPTFDSYWKQRGFYTAGYYRDMKDVPILFLTGWYDYFSQGVLENFTQLSRLQPHTIKRLVVGPWPHATGEADCGDASFGNSGAVDQRALMADWFDHWTKHRAFKLVSDLPVQYFRMGGGGGERTAKNKLDHGGEWLTSLAWPPASARPAHYFLHASGDLNNLTPRQEKDSPLTYDPNDPVPTLGGRYGLGAWSKSCAQDGRMDRTDILSFSTDMLKEGVDVTGRVQATIWAQSTAHSADFIAKLLDVYPDGYALTLIDGGTRVVFRTANAPEKVVVDLGSVSNLFAKGHRIRVDIARSNFPKLDTNPNTGSAVILHDQQYPSSLSLPIVAVHDDYDSSSSSAVTVAMRDGTMLATDVYRPANGGQPASGTFPVLVSRTPYNKNGERQRGEFFARHGYVFVAQDVRGTNGSEGYAYPLIHEAKDGYDTIEWAAVQPWSTGKVATTGASYLAMDQYAAAIEEPPHLVAMYAAVGSENYYYDAAYHGGIPSLGWPVWLLLSAATDPRTRPDARRKLTEIVNHPDEWLSESREERAKLLAPYPAQLQAYEDFYAHPTFDSYWRQTGFDTADYYGRMKDVPMLFVSGWYDTFADATLQNFAALRQRQKTPKRLVMGAWPHGYGKSTCGVAEFGPKDELDERSLQLDWFDHWLKGRPFELNRDENVQYFQMGGSQTERNGKDELTPGGEWKSASTWPPAPAKSERWFLGNKELSRQTSAAAPPDHYLYDPANPVHTLGGRQGPECIQDQVQQRQDVETYLSQPLSRAEDVTGKVRVVLWATTDAASADFTAKLIDVYPDGFAAPLLDGAIRIGSQSKEPQRVVIELGTTSNLFAAGHRIRVDISSSGFPKFEPNPIPAHNSIFHDLRHASYVDLPVMER